MNGLIPRVPAWVAIFVLVSCASADANFTDALAGGYTTIETAAESVAIARDGGLITEEKAQEHKQRLQIALDSLNEARTAYYALEQIRAQELLYLSLAIANRVSEEINQ